MNRPPYSTAPIAPNRPLTSGQVARVLFVCPRTVNKWADSGRLKCFRIPGSTDRRFPPEAVIAFCSANGFPVPPELQGGGLFAFGFASPAESPPGAALYSDPFEFARELCLARPTAIAIGDSEGASAARRALQFAAGTHPAARLILVVGPDVTDTPVVPAGTTVLRAPVAWAGVGL